MLAPFRKPIYLHRGFNPNGTNGNLVHVTELVFITLMMMMMMMMMMAADRTARVAEPVLVSERPPSGAASLRAFRTRSFGNSRVCVPDYPQMTLTPPDASS